MSNSSGFIQQLDGEIEVVERDIASNPDPRTVKLAELKKLRALYAPQEAKAAPSPSLWLDREASELNARSRSTHQKVVAATRDYLILNDDDRPVPLGDIYAFLQKKGIEIGGKTPKNTLSAILSNSDLFQSHGRSGWTLVGQKEKRPADDDALASKSSAGPSSLL